MKIKKILTVTLASVLLTSTMIGFVGCGKSTGSNGNGDKKAETQELNLILLEPESLDVNACKDTNTSTVLNAIQEGLIRAKANKDGKDELVEAGAEKWDVSKDGLVYTFKLRDYNWSDGKKVTAQHYVDSFRRLVNKELAFPYAFFGYAIKNGEKINNGELPAEQLGVVAKDDNTLEITLERPDPTFLGKLSYQCFLPVRLDIINANPDKYSNDGPSQVVCGPYKIESWEANNSLVLVKNDAYWDAKNVDIQKVNMKDIKEFSTQAQLFESGQLDVTGSNSEYLKKWKEEAQNGDFQYKTQLTPATWYFTFNQKNSGPSGLMDNVKIRKAFSLAANRKEFVETIYGRYVPAYGLIPSVINDGDKPYRDSTPEPLKPEVEKATNESLQALLKEGLAEKGVKTNNLKDVKFKFITFGDSAMNRQVQEFWKQNFENKLGITLETEVLGDSKLYTAAKKDFKFDLVFSGWGADYNDPISFLDMWTSKNGNNGAGYNNPDYDKLIDSLEGEKDLAKRQEIYAKAEEIIVSRDAVVAPIFYADMNIFLVNDLKNFQFPEFGPSYEWRWAYKVAQ